MKVLSKITLLSALAAVALSAQPQGGPPDPATMVERRIERLTQILGLTATQATQATTIFTNAETAISPIQTNVRTYRTSLGTAVKGNQVGTIDQLAGQIGAAEGQILAIQSKAEASFYAILTSDQQTKVNSMPGILGGGGRGPGGPGGFGPRMRQ